MNECVNESRLNDISTIFTSTPISIESSVYPTLHLQPFTPKPSVDYGTIAVGHQQTLYLRVNNPTHELQQISIDKLPTKEGFTIREVDFLIPPNSAHFLIPIMWTPMNSGYYKATVIFLWGRMKLQVTLCGTAVISDAPHSNQSLLLNNSFLKRGMQTDTSRVEKERAKKLQLQQSVNISKLSMSVNNTSSKKLNSSVLSRSTMKKNVSFISRNNKENDSPNVNRSSILNKSSVRITKPTKMNSTLAPPKPTKPKSLPHNNSSNRTVIQEELNASRRQELAVQRSQNHSMLKQMRDEQNRFKKEIPMTERDLIEELTFCIERFKSQLSLNSISIQGYQDIRISYLLQWVQINIRAYTHPMIVDLAVPSFSAPSFRKDSEKLFKLLVNQYRSPQPLPIEQLFPPQQPKKPEIKGEFDAMKLIAFNSSSWAATFSPKKIEVLEEEDNFNEKEMILKVAHLFVKLSTLRRSRASVEGFLEYAIPIQAVIGRHLTIANIAAPYFSIIQSQSVIRTVLAHKALQQRQTQAYVSMVSVAQSAIRMSLQHQNLKIRLQIEAARREEYERMNRGAITCQRVLRGFLTRNKISSPVIRSDQTEVRGNQALVYKVSGCQSAIRQSLEQQHLERQQNLYSIYCTIACQSAVRRAFSISHAQYLQHVQFMNAVQSVESIVRTSFAVEQLQARKHLDAQIRLVVCQAVIRTKLGAINLHEYKSFLFSRSVDIWQASVRRALSQKNITYRYGSTKVVQKTSRKAGKVEDLSTSLKKITGLQALIRTAVERDYKSEALYHSRLLEEYSAIKIQRVFRGFRVRKLDTDALEIRRRLQHLSETVEERQQFRNRTKQALAVLMNSKKMTHIMDACTNLDTTTSYSSRCRESLVQEGAVSILFSLMKSCNRSKPHMDLLHHILNILYSLSNSGYTAYAVFEFKDSMTILVEQLQMYRDKEEIFFKVLRILNLHSTRLKQQKQFSVVTKRVVKQLKSIASIMEKKYSLEKKYEQTIKGKQLSSVSMMNGSMLSSSSNGSRNKPPTTVVSCYESLVQYIRTLEE